MDHLDNHGTSAASPALYPSFYGAATEYLRGSWEYLRGHFISYREAEIIYGGDFQFTGTDNTRLRFSAHQCWILRPY